MERVTQREREKSEIKRERSEEKLYCTWLPTEGSNESLWPLIWVRFCVAPLTSWYTRGLTYQDTYCLNLIFNKSFPKSFFVLSPPLRMCLCVCEREREHSFRKILLTCRKGSWFTYFARGTRYSNTCELQQWLSDTQLTQTAETSVLWQSSGLG